MVQGHICEAPVSVIIHQDVKEDARIPISGDGITIHERKGGPTSITRRAEVDFPLEAFGEEWWQYIKAFEEVSGPQLATVEAAPFDISKNPDISADTFIDVTGAAYPEFKNKVMTGYIGRVGGDGTNTGHISIFGPYKLLNSIPVTQTFNTSDNVLADIFLWLEDEFESSQPYFDNVSSEILGLDPNSALGPVSRIAYGTKNFTRNRDTLADVFKWVRKSIGLKIWFEPNVADASVRIVGEVPSGKEIKTAADTSQIPSSPVGDWFDDRREELNQDVPRTEIGKLVNEAQNNYRTEIEHMEVAVERSPSVAMFDATHGGNLQVIDNMALFEMKPYNAVNVKGKIDKGIAGTGVDLETAGLSVFAIPTDTTSYPEATATYPPLVDRNGAVLPLEITSSALDEEAVGEEARSELKDILDDVSGGTMTFVAAPYLSPFDLVIATPACNGLLNTEIIPLVYEIERTAHTFNPNNQKDGSPVYTTEAAVTMHADPALIEVETTTKTVQPDSGSDNVPTEEDWNATYDIVK